MTNDTQALFTSTKSSTLAKSRRCCGVALIVAEVPLLRAGWSLLGRLVQIWPPRRLGISLKFLLRTAMGPATALSIMNSRSRVLRAVSRVMFLLIVTRTVPPGLTSMAMVMDLTKNRGVIGRKRRRSRRATAGKFERGSIPLARVQA